MAVARSRLDDDDNLVIPKLSAEATDLRADLAGMRPCRRSPRC
ncbi:hypothetical protein [Streptosporangium canum]